MIVAPEGLGLSLQGLPAVLINRPLRASRDLDRKQSLRIGAILGYAR